MSFRHFSSLLALSPTTLPPIQSLPPSLSLSLSFSLALPLSPHSSLSTSFHIPPPHDPIQDDKGADQKNYYSIPNCETQIKLQNTAVIVAYTQI